MNKKNMKAAFLGFLVACAGAYTVYATRDDDPRATEFAKYISADIDAMVARHLTDAEIQEYVDSYRRQPELFESWVKNLTEDSMNYNRSLVKNAAVIHKLDSVAGRKLAFDEALQRVQELPDTCAHPDQDVMLQRVINGKKFADSNIALSRAAMKRAKSEK